MSTTTIPFEEVRAWMFGAALPLWGSAGKDPRGGFHEELDLAGRPAASPFKRIRVTCRQTYVFAHAYELGWEPGLELSAHGAALLAETWRGPVDGWPRRLTPEHAVLDPTLDLYDLAFVLLAWAWRYRVAKEETALEGAKRVVEVVRGQLRAPHGGYWHARPATGPRQQNPHMHLLEASLVALEATRESIFLELARELSALFRAKLFDGRTLAEYFEPDWRRAAGDPGRLIEPGHHFEWAWLLVQHERLTGERTTPLVEALMAFAERHGVDQATQATFNSIRDDGTPLDRGSRTWPNTERLKGHLALYEATGKDPRAAVAGSTRRLLDLHLATDVPGLWIDHFDAEGRGTSKTAPASTLYHVFLAFAELLRLEPRLRRLQER